MFKTNVVKNDYCLLAEDKATKVVFKVHAESLESAKLKLPSDVKFLSAIQESQVALLSEAPVITVVG